MRVRTGHGPDDWDDKGPGAVVSDVIRGALVIGQSGKEMTPDQRAAYMRKRRSELAAGAEVSRRWGKADDCGAWMPLAKEPCARRAGHRDDHATAARMGARRQYQRGIAA